MLRIAKTVIDGIISHSRKDAPIEACGYCAESNGIIDAWFPLTNTDGSHEHFSLDPAEQFACVKKIRSQGRRLAAVYHSHPETPSRPSAEDIALAADPDISYVIVSLANNESTVKSFKIRNSIAVEESIEITGDII